jgi:hypothetical protein
LPGSRAAFVLAPGRSVAVVVVSLPRVKATLMAQEAAVAAVEGWLEPPWRRTMATCGPRPALTHLTTLYESRVPMELSLVGDPLIQRRVHRQCSL